MNDKIGITTTIPQEVIWAAGKTPVDLNNLFLASELRDSFLNRAYRDGYPRTTCAWIAGIYGAVVDSENIDTVIFVTEGDCSNTHALAETLEIKGIEVIPFAYPYNGDSHLLRSEIEALARHLDTDMFEVEEWFEKLKRPRQLAAQVDYLTWAENRISSLENHLCLVTSSDFNGDIEKYCESARVLIDESSERIPFTVKARLAYIGVPPIFPELFDFIDSSGARVVFNEVQRQFALPFFDVDMISAYASYTYPTKVFRRIEDIIREIKLRRIDGVIHYTQSFCFRQIEDLLFRKFIDVPILTIEGESQFDLDERTRIRIESFIQMLADRQ